MSTQFNNSMPFNIDLDVDDERINQLVATVEDSARRYLAATKKTYDKGRYTSHLRLILLNLLKAYRQNRQRYVAISMDRNHYYPQRQGAQGFWVSFGPIRDLVLALEKGKWIEPRKKGYHYRNPFGGVVASSLTRMRGSEKLKDLFRRMRDIYENENRIVLRDDEGKIRDYEETAETSRMRENLDRINETLARHFIGLYIPDDHHAVLAKKMGRKGSGFDPSKYMLTRSFKDNFKSGGRFYSGWWIDLPKEFRPHIRIDDEETEERDFSGTSINLLYLLSDLEPPVEDVYTLPDPHGMGMHPGGRDFMKNIVQAMINTSSKPAAVEAVQFQLNIGGSVHIPLKAKEVVDCMEKKHSPISALFYRNMSGTLFRAESHIAESVLLRLASKNIPALPVHDAFIVRKRDVKELERTMVEAVTEKYPWPLPFKAGNPSPFAFMPSEQEERQRYSLYFKEREEWLRHQVDNHLPSAA